MNARLQEIHLFMKPIIYDTSVLLVVVELLLIYEKILNSRLQFVCKSSNVWTFCILLENVVKIYRY